MIKQIFGVMKKCFKVLAIPQEYDLKTQAQLVCMLTVVHNFMKLHDPDDPLFKDKNIGSELDLEGDDTTTTQATGSQREPLEAKRVMVHRDKIAHVMWKDYWSKKKNHT